MSDSIIKCRNLYRIYLFWVSLYVLFYMINAYTAITFPYAIDYGEGILLNQAKLISQGINIYQDISDYPFTMAMYTPLYSLLSSLFIKFFGISFSSGRFISVASAIIIGILIYVIIKEKTNRQIALLSSLIFFGSPYIYAWTSLFRVDTLGLLFSLCGIYFVYKYENNNNVYVAIPFFILSIYTKQSFIAAPLASVIYLVLRDKKRGIAFAGLMGLSVIIPYAIINYFTEGEFYLHTVVYNASTFSIKMAVVRYLEMMKSHMILFGFAMTYTIYKLSNRELRLIIIYFMIAVVMAISVGKPGASVNYFLELIAISCMLSGALLGEMKFRIDNEILSNKLIIVLLLLQLVSFFNVPHGYWWRQGQDKATAINNFNKISSYVKQANDNILSQDASFVVLNGKPYLYQPAVLTELQRQGIWDQSRLVGDLQDEKYSLLLLYFDVNDENSFNNHRAYFTNEMRDAIRHNYYIKEKVHGSYIYMPKSRRIKS